MPSTERSSCTSCSSRAAFDEIDADPHHDAWLGRVDGIPTFLTETYDPAHSVLAAHYRVTPGQLGMHVLVAPTETPVHGMTSQVFRAVMHFCFRDPAVTEVVVEPDVRNLAIHAKNAAAGFVLDRRITLSDKEALLSFCTLADFAGSELEGRRGALPSPDVAHLEPEVMARAHRHVAAKAIGELTHERVLAPELLADGRLDAVWARAVRPWALLAWSFLTLGIAMFDQANDWGTFGVLAKPLFKLLSSLYHALGNYGLAIIALTALVRLVLFPIASKQFNSMNKMRLVAPKMKELQERYKDDNDALRAYGLVSRDGDHWRLTDAGAAAQAGLRGAA